jgi:hypothetical protein
MLLCLVIDMAAQSAGAGGEEPVQDIKGLPKNTRVMAPLGDVLYPGIVAEPQADEPLGEAMIRVEFTPPVRAEPPFNTIDAITCPVDRVVVGWF